jgi:hypothetical protein
MAANLHLGCRWDRFGQLRVKAASGSAFSDTPFEPVTKQYRSMNLEGWTLEFATMFQLHQTTESGRG